MTGIAKRLVCISAALWLSPGLVSADLIVGNTPLPKADKTTYPKGVSAHDVTINGDFNENHLGADYMYDGTGHTLLINNEFFAVNTKHVWLMISYTPGDSLPQHPGAAFDPTKWPTITVSEPAGVTGTITPTGASAITGNTIYMTWDITPQPSSELLRLNFPGLGGDWDGVDKVEASTICTVTPLPEPSTATIAVSAIVASGATGLARRTRGRHRSAMRLSG